MFIILFGFIGRIWELQCFLFWNDFCNAILKNWTFGVLFGLGHVAEIWHTGMLLLCLDLKKIALVFFYVPVSCNIYSKQIILPQNNMFGLSRFDLRVYKALKLLR